MLAALNRRFAVSARLADFCHLFFRPRFNRNRIVAVFIFSFSFFQELSNFFFVLVVVHHRSGFNADPVSKTGV